MDLLAWIAGAFFTIIILGLLFWLIKAWFESLKNQFEKIVSELTASIDKLTKKIETLFERSEADRIERMNCKLDAQQTYATKKEMAELAGRVSDLEKAGRIA